MPRLISQIAHVEVITPKLEESRAFFAEVIGLEEVERVGQSVYLRAPQEIFHHSLVLTEGDEPALGHIGWRADSPEDLEILVGRLTDDDVEGWVPASVGHGPAFRFRGPGGHPHELFWEVTRATCPPGEESRYPSRVQRVRPRGAAVQQLDHATVATADPWGDTLWYQEKMGFRHVEYTVLDEDTDKVVFSCITTNEKSHDLGLLIDHSNRRGRLHHVSYWVPER